MRKNIFKIITKYIAFVFIWSILLFAIAITLLKTKGYLLKDILFVEGLLFILLGTLSSISGNPIGISIQSLGQNNSQFNSNVNLEVSKIEKEKTKDILKLSISPSIGAISLIVVGIFSIISTFIN